MSNKRLFKTEEFGDIIVVMPLRDMGEFELVELDTPALTQLVEMTNGRNVVVDLSQTDYFGSSTIGLFIQFTKHVHSQDRRIAFCNLSSHEQQVVGITHVDQLLDIRKSRTDAIEFVSKKGTVTVSDE